VLTIYGRNAVYEALQDDAVSVHKLHLSKANKPAKVLDAMVTLAKKRVIEVAYHDKQSLSRISKNAKQDQGVALDIVLDGFMDAASFLSSRSRYNIIALDGVQNPINLGMIIRSCVAGRIDAIVLPTAKSAKISPLAIKASAGTLFKSTIIHTKDLQATLREFKKEGADIYTLSSHATTSYQEHAYSDKNIFVLGNESEGVTPQIEALCDQSITIPLNNGVESLNVAVTAALIAFMTN
jgi:23S rRNA (guanosine2251-2'-O)-methyltransferase